MGRDRRRSLSAIVAVVASLETTGCISFSTDTIVLDVRRRAAVTSVEVYRERLPPARAAAHLHGYLAAWEGPKARSEIHSLDERARAQVADLERQARAMGCDAMVVRRQDVVIVKRSLLGPDVEIVNLGHVASCFVWQNEAP